MYQNLMSWSCLVVAINFLKFQTLLFLFSNKMVVIRADLRIIIVRIANSEDPDQTASLEVV